MPNAAPARRERALAAERLGARLLEHLALGASLEDIARQENLTRRAAEKLLRKQLDRFSVQRTDEFAKLQICRLDAMIGTLSVKAREGDVAALSLSLKAIDRMDRYHGFGKSNAAPAASIDVERRRLADKIERLAAATNTETAPDS